MFHRQLTFAFIVAMFVSANSFAAGFERPVTFSGKWAALGGAASAKVSGGDAVAFNPAGIARSKKGSFSLNFSPTISSNEGPVIPQQGVDNSVGIIESGESVTNIGYGALFGKRVNNKLGIGLGVYQIGSLQGEFADVDVSTNTSYAASFINDSVTDIKFNEVAVGLSYIINENWLVGASIRGTIARANIDRLILLTDGGNDDAVSLRMNDLGDESFGGFKFGTQYISPDKMWGAGFTYRTSVDLEMEGTLNGSGIDNGTSSPFTGGAVTMATSLPEEMVLGFYFKTSKQDTLFAEASLTKYSENQKLDFTGSYTFITSQSIADITLNWEDQTSLKFGFEHDAGKFKIRGGYVYSSQVTSSDESDATFTPPSVTHTVVGGMGLAVSKKLSLDGAVEYSFANGSGNTTDENGGYGNFSGEFDYKSYGLHGSLNYHF